MKRNEDNKVIFKVLVGFVLTFLLVVFMQYNKTMATGEVYYMNDLKVGDFIPDGATLIADKYNIGGSGGFYESASIKYYMNRSNYEFDYFLPSDSYVILSEHEIFDDVTNEYLGWVVEDSYDNYMILIPADSSYVVSDSKPSKDNNYQLCGKCYDKSSSDLVNASSYRWYKSESLDYKVLNNYFKGNFDYLKNGFEYFFDYRVQYSTYDEASNNLFEETINFEFELSKDDVLIFDNYIASNYFSAYFISKNTSYTELINKHFNKFVIPADGKYSIELVLSSYIFDNSVFSEHYIVFRNMKVLTPLNEGDKLDASLVSEGDEIYYEVECDNGYVLGDSFIYEVPPVEEDPPVEEPPIEDEIPPVEEEPEEVPPVDEPVIENPETNDYVKVIIFALMISLTVVIITFNRYKKLD